MTYVLIYGHFIATGNWTSLIQYNLLSKTRPALFPCNIIAVVSVEKILTQPHSMRLLKKSSLIFYSFWRRSDCSKISYFTSMNYGDSCYHFCSGATGTPSDAVFYSVTLANSNANTHKKMNPLTSNSVCCAYRNVAATNQWDCSCEKHFEIKTFVVSPVAFIQTLFHNESIDGTN